MESAYLVNRLRFEFNPHPALHKNITHKFGGASAAANSTYLRKYIHFVNVVFSLRNKLYNVRSLGLIYFNGISYIVTFRLFLDFQYFYMVLDLRFITCYFICFVIGNCWWNMFNCLLLYYKIWHNDYVRKIKLYF